MQQTTDHEPRPPAVPGSLVQLFERPDPGLAVTLSGSLRRASWPAGLGRIRLAVGLLLTPVFFALYRGVSTPAAPMTPGWVLALGTMGLLAGLTVATYLPIGKPGTASSPCAAIAGGYVLFAAMALDGPADPAAAAVALALLAFGLRQRLRGASACAP